MSNLNIEEKEKTLENLKLYHIYIDLIYYTYLIVQKYPKSQKFSIVTDIIQYTNNGMYYLIKAQEEKNNIEKRIEYLNNVLDEHMMLIVLVRVSKKGKFINPRNYQSWSNKIQKIDNGISKWLYTCQRQLKDSLKKN